MNIGINGYEAVVPRFGFNKDGLPNRVGSSEFCYQLLVSLSNIDKKNNYFVYLPQAPVSDMPKENLNWHYVVFSSKKLWTLFGLTKKIMGNPEKLDVFFSPTHYSPITNIKTVISILDVSYMHFQSLFKKSDLYKLKYWGRYSINNAKKIITISESSKNDIIKTYNKSENKIDVVYPGIKKTIEPLTMEELIKKYNISKDYILFVGTLQPRKNILRLIESFSKINSAQQLVIVGRKGWQFEDILEAPKKFNVEMRVKFVFDVGEEDLPGFYKNARMLVLPSLYEGFGLPVIEAMQYGCPVITSNVSSLPEAGGDAALYVDPENVDEITAKIKQLLTDDELRNSLIAKGKEHIKKFSWDKAAEQTLAVLEGVASGKDK